MSKTIKDMLLLSLDQSGLVKTIKEYIVDKKYPLEDRWEVFCKAVDNGLAEQDPFMINLNSLHDDIIMYEGLVHADRYMTIDIPSIIERYEDNFQENGEPWKSNNLDKWEEFNFDPVAFKEEVMEKFIGSFVYDW